jgi:hypothetical protein
MYSECYARGGIMSKTKGIAIRVPVSMLQQIEDHQLSRNELVNQALNLFFNTDETKKTGEDETIIPDELYEEAYNAIYNTELVPLQQHCAQQQKLIEVLQDEVTEFKADKRFLKDQITRLQEQKKSRFSFFKKNNE